MPATDSSTDFSAAKVPTACSCNSVKRLLLELGIVATWNGSALELEQLGIENCVSCSCPVLVGKSESWRRSGRGEGSRCGASERIVRASPEECRFSVGVLKGEGKGTPRLQRLIDVQPEGEGKKKS